MNTVFLLLMLASLFSIPIFLIMGLVNVIRKRSPKKRFKLAGISVLVLIASFIGFGFTLDDDASPKEDGFSTISAETPESTYTLAENISAEPSPTPATDLAPSYTPSPTPIPTVVPTPEPTIVPTPTPTATAIPEPVPTPTAAPTPNPTPAPTPMPTEAPTPQPTTEPQTPPNSESTSQSSGGSGSGDASNFDTYDNTDQQQTADTYVLNTSSHKIHHPNCSSVPKIAPQNYATSSESIADLQAQGYSTCGICFK